MITTICQLTFSQSINSSRTNTNNNRNIHQLHHIRPAVSSARYSTSFLPSFCIFLCLSVQLLCNWNNTEPKKKPLSRSSMLIMSQSIFFWLVVVVFLRSTRWFQIIHVKLTFFLNFFHCVLFFCSSVYLIRFFPYRAVLYTCCIAVYIYTIAAGSIKDEINDEKRGSSISPSISVDGSYACSQCSASFVHRDLLEKHELMHSPNPQQLVVSTCCFLFLLLLRSGYAHTQLQYIWRCIPLCHC